MNELTRKLWSESVLKAMPRAGHPYNFEIAAQDFADAILNDIDKIVDSLYHILPLEQAAVLITLDEQIKAHFYGIDDE